MLHPSRYLFLFLAPSLIQQVAAGVDDRDELALKCLEVAKNLTLGLLHALELRQVELQVRRV